MNIFAGIGDLFSLIINRPLGWILFYCYQLGKNYGIALILFTLITRVLLLPLAVKQQKSSAEMIRMQPKLNEIQKKYAKDKTKQSEELQKLYTEEGYNPLAGCLPMIIQIPILFGLFGVIYKPLTYILGLTTSQVNRVVSTLTPQIETLLHHAIKAADQSKIEIYAAQAMNGNMDKLSFLPSHVIALNFHFLGMDLSQTPTLGFNLLILIPVLCYATNFLYMWASTKLMAMPNQQSNPMNNKMMLVLMPVMSTVFSLQLPAGVGFYWIVTNLFMLLQIYVLNIFYNPKKLAEQAEVAAKKRKEDRQQARRLAQAAAQTGKSEEDPEKKEETGKGETAPDDAPPNPVVDTGEKTKKQIKEENRRRLAASRKNENRKEQQN